MPINKSLKPFFISRSAVNHEFRKMSILSGPIKFTHQSDGTTTKLATTVTFIIKQKEFTVPESEEVFKPDWETAVSVATAGVAVVLGIVVLVTIFPEMAGASAFISAFRALFS